MKVIRDWMAERVIQLLGIEDEVVVEYAIGMLEEPVRSHSATDSLYRRISFKTRPEETQKNCQ